MLNLKTPQVDIILIFLIPLCLKLFLNSFLVTPGSFMIQVKKELKCRLSDMHSLAQLGDIENKLKIQT